MSNFHALTALAGLRLQSVTDSMPTVWVAVAMAMDGTMDSTVAIADIMIGWGQDYHVHDDERMGPRF